ncbi:hypothetical protein [Vulcanisaeta thermophila]|uniref:hypothetical protein n=1 Tax=Vulcanisaeta thermophila TaxID=867917 RepID=UPI000ACBD5EF|nr:hypothetical protein [Vulcanisaeta thermophila]
MSNDSARRIRSYHLVLPMISPLMGIPLIMALIAIGETQVSPGPPFQSSNTVSTGIYNVLVMALIMAIATYVIYSLVRRGLIRAFEALKDVLLSIVVISSTAFFVITYVYGFNITPLMGYPTLALIAVLSALIIYASLKPNNMFVRALAIGSYSSMAGVILTIALPTWTVVLLLVALPIYDIIMVYKGLLGRLVTELSKYGEGRYPLLRGLILDMDGLGIGVGDLVLYSLLTSFTVLEYEYHGYPAMIGLIAAMASILGIFIGLLITLWYLLPIKKYAPALPIPLLLGSTPLIYLALRLMP